MGTNGLRTWPAARGLLGRDGCAAEDEGGQGPGKGDGGNVHAHCVPLWCHPPRQLPERLPTFPTLQAKRHGHIPRGRTHRGAHRGRQRRLRYWPCQ